MRRSLINKTRRRLGSSGRHSRSNSGPYSAPLLSNQIFVHSSSPTRWQASDLTRQNHLWWRQPFDASGTESRLQPRGINHPRRGTAHAASDDCSLEPLTRLAMDFLPEKCILYHFQYKVDAILGPNKGPTESFSKWSEMPRSLHAWRQCPWFSKRDARDHNFRLSKPEALLESLVVSLKDSSSTTSVSAARHPLKLGRGSRFRVMKAVQTFEVYRNKLLPNSSSSTQRNSHTQSSYKINYLCYSFN